MRKILKRILITLFFLFILVVILLSYLRYEALKRISDFVRIYGSFSSLDLNTFPPALFATELSLKLPEKMGELKAKNARIEIATRGLFSRKLNFRLYLESPSLKIYNLNFQKGKKRRYPDFEIENGRILNGSLKLEIEGKEIEIEKINGNFYLKGKRIGLNIKDSIAKVKDEKSGIEEEGKIKLFLRSEKGRVRIRKLEFESRYGTISTHGNIFQENGSLQIEGGILADFIPLKVSRNVKIQGRVEGDYKIDKIQDRFSVETSLKIFPKINGENIKELFLQSKFDEKFKGEFRIESFYNRKKWECSFKSLEDKNYLVKIQNFPAELLKVFYPKIPKGFLINFEGEVEKEKLGGEYNLFSEMDGYVSGDLNYGRENLYIQMKDIKIKGIQGDGNLKLDKGNLEISGNFNEVSLRELKDSNLLKTFVDLSFIPSIEGRGNLDMKILGDMKNLGAEAELNFKDVKISKFNAGNISGKLKGPIRELNFEGTFKNGIFEGTAKGSTGKRELQIEIEKMNEERISGFLKVPLNGFVNISFKNGISAEGKLNAPFLKVKSIELKNLSIPFNFEDGTLNTSFTFSTKISDSNGFLSLSMKDKKYKFSTSQITFELSEFYKNLKGTWEISLNGQGEIYSSQVDIKGKIRDFSFQIDSIRNYVLEGKIGINKNSLSASGNLLSTDKKDYLQFSTEIVRDGSIKGTFEGKIISIEKIIKFPGEGVNVRFLGEISGKYDSLKIQSISNFEGRSFFIKGFAHDFRDFSGTLQQIKDMVYLKNFRAKIGGGGVMGFGEARIENLSLENINVNLEGEKMRLAPFEKVDGIGDGRIELRGNLDEITIDGSFFVNRVFWRKEIGEKIAFSSAPSPSDSPKIFQKINLNIELISNGNAWMDNSWGKAEGKFNLRIKGDSSNPILLGTISGTRGELIVGDRRFKLIKADIYFNSPFTIDPELYILADTYVKDYRVIFEVKGKASKPLPALSSSPPLPPQDILTLLALGEIYQRTSYRTGTQLGSASLISMELSEQLKTKAKKLFGLDRLRVDPYLLGSSSNPVARVTVGKKISKDLVVLYSSDLTGQREYIVYIEYSISDNLSLIGMRNENGALSFDLKLVKRISQ